MALRRCHRHPRSPACQRRPAAKRGADAQGLGRSKGGLGTKIHAATDGLGNPVSLIASPGHRGEVLYAADLIKGFAYDAVIADRAYDAEHFHDTILDAGAVPVIPPRPNRRRPHTYDRDLYKERNLIERFFNKLKHFRRVATRYDKLLANFMGFVKLGAIHLLLR
jgi:putative transposase